MKLNMKNKTVQLLMYVLQILMVVVFVAGILSAVNQAVAIIHMGEAASVGPFSAGIITLFPFFVSEIVLIAFYVFLLQKTRTKGTSSSNEKWLFRKHISASLLVLFLIIVFCFYLELYLIQDKLIYYPNNNNSNTVSRIQNLKQISLDGGRYSGYIRECGSETLIVFFYGNAQNAAGSMLLLCDQQGLVADLLEGYDIMVVDYPGYGTSMGIPNEKTIMEMADAVQKEVERTGDYKKKHLLAYSLGTGVATYLASRGDWDSLVLIAPYNNMVDVCQSFLPVFWGPLKKMIKNLF